MALRNHPGLKKPIARIWFCPPRSSSARNMRASCAEICDVSGMSRFSCRRNRISPIGSRRRNIGESRMASPASTIRCRASLILHESAGGAAGDVAQARRGWLRTKSWIAARTSVGARPEKSRVSRKPSIAARSSASCRICSTDRPWRLT